MKPTKKLKICVWSPFCWQTGKAKSKAIGAGPIIGIEILRPKPGATRTLSTQLRDRRLHRAGIDEHHAAEHVVGRDREQVLRRAQHLEVAAHAHAVDRVAGRHAAEGKAADRRETARIVALENRRVIARVAGLEP